MTGRRALRWIVVVVVAVAALAATHVYTARSQFCGSCHSAMGEYVKAWSASSHHDCAECLDCHSDPGWVGYYHGKVEGVRNAVSYYFGIRRTEEMPPPGPAACLRRGCHTDAELSAQTSRAPFAHETHLASLRCVNCHPGVGHEPAETERPKECSDCHPGDATSGA